MSELTRSAETHPSASPSATAAAPLSGRTVRLYGVGQAAEGIKNHSFTHFLLFYYTSVLGISGSLAGAALMIALVFDAITDPLVAVYSDRTRSRWGRRHPYLFASALPLGAFFCLAFAPPAGLGEGGLFLWLLVCSVLTRASMTLFHVPHMALGAELSDDFDERTRVVAARSFSGVMGGTVAVLTYFGLVALLARAEYADPRLNPTPYATYGFALGLVIVGAVLATAWGTADRIPHLLPPTESLGGRGVLAILVSDMVASLRLPAFRALFLGFTLCFLAFGVTNALSNHNALYFWHVSVEQQLFLGVFNLTGLVLGMGFWRGYAERFDKRPTFITGLTWFTIFVAFPPLLKVAGLFPPEASFFYLPTLGATNFLWSFGIASSMVVVGSMMADITDADELASGVRREGIFFGSLSFSGKAATGLGTVIAGVVYDAVGLRQGLDPAAAPASASDQLGLLTGGILLVLVGLSFAVFRRYDITRARHTEIRAALDARGLSSGGGSG